MRYIAALLLFVLSATAAHAQATVETCTRSTPTGFCQANNATNPLPTARVDYPPGATIISATSGNVAAASATATLAGTSGKTTYINGFIITGAGATAASNVSCSVGTLIGGVIWNFTVVVPAGVNTAITPIVVMLPKAIPANATNTSISVTCPSFGAGNTNAAVNAFGYQL